MKNRENRFSIDLIINYAAFIVAGLAGLLFLFVCAHFLGMDGLGVVSQVMAIYLITGQLAVIGIQFSSLKTAGDPQLSTPQKNVKVWSAILTAMIWGGAFSILAFLLSHPIGELLSSPRVAEAWKITAPALVLFAVNKVSASALNGLNKMRHFATQLSLRGLLLLLFSTILAIQNTDPVTVCFAFLLTEICLSIFLITQMIRFFGMPAISSLSRNELTEHFSFGLKGIWSGLAYEFNTKMDVVMVGIFLSDASVGLYALAAQLAEGFFNLLVVLRNQLAPVISKLVVLPDIQKLRELGRRLLITVVPIAAMLAIIGVALYKPVIGWVLPGQGYEEAALLLAILLTGIVFNSWIMPLDTILIVSGNPGYYSIMMGGVTLSNLLLNLVLIYHFALIGAAAATCISMVLSGIYLLFMVRYRLGFWMLPGAGRDI